MIVTILYIDYVANRTEVYVIDADEEYNAQLSMMDGCFAVRDAIYPNIAAFKYDIFVQEFPAGNDQYRVATFSDTSPKVEGQYTYRFGVKDATD